MGRPLSERVVLVTGASRGVGRGIAHELGEAGAAVYVTGRSREGHVTEDLPGSVEETARLVTEAGGWGIPVLCDHSKDTEVRALAERIRGEAGRLDLLVNNVWGGYEEYDADLFALPVWEQPIWRWDKMFKTGVRAHYTTSRAMLPLLLEAPRPLLITLSAGDRGHFLGDVQYDVAKAAIDRLAFALAHRHRDDGLTAFTLHPGFTRTERTVSALAETHSPRFVGRAVVALATNPQVHRDSGSAYHVEELARELGFTDVDGIQLEPFALPPNG